MSEKPAPPQHAATGTASKSPKLQHGTSVAGAVAGLLAAGLILLDHLWPAVQHLNLAGKIPAAIAIIGAGAKGVGFMAGYAADLLPGKTADKVEQELAKAQEWATIGTTTLDQVAIDIAAQRKHMETVVLTANQAVQMLLAQTTGDGMVSTGSAAVATGPLLMEQPQQKPADRPSEPSELDDGPDTPEQPVEDTGDAARPQELQETGTPSPADIPVNG